MYCAKLPNWKHYQMKFEVKMKSIAWTRKSSPKKPLISMKNHTKNENWKGKCVCIILLLFNKIKIWEILSQEKRVFVRFISEWKYVEY